MNIAVLVGKEAAGGRAAQQAARLAMALRGHRVHSVTGWGGEEIGGTVHKAPAAEAGYVASLHAAVDVLYEQGPALYLFWAATAWPPMWPAAWCKPARRPRILGIAAVRPMWAPSLPSRWMSWKAFPDKISLFVATPWKPVTGRASWRWASTTWCWATPCCPPSMVRRSRSMRCGWRGKA